MGRRTALFTNSPPPCRLGNTVKHQHSGATVKHQHSQHTVNPLIALHVNPFLPSAISTVSVLFLSTDHCIGVTGDVSDTISVPPTVRMPAAVPQSCYPDRCDY
ncbi:unnamed protein product [Staurois parvus]|uniref:Uncharacterized protein n=1 Tax=Staurois parvus TaxID=386267 RepID=A0ABN9ED92_9NEOB|nr:unnamed protein product [Staurois parvus]